MQFKTRNRFAIALLASMAVFTTSCTFGPNFESPEVTTPDSWRDAGNEKLEGEPLNQIEWWNQFNDPTMESLISQAMRDNTDLQAAALRIVQARIGRAVASEMLLPIVTGKATGAHVWMSETQKPDVEVSIPDLKLPGKKLQKPNVSMQPELDLYNASFDAIWELDIWGVKRRGIESKAALLGAAYASYDDMMVTLAGEVAATYIQIRAVQTRLATTQENIALMEQFQTAAQERFDRHEGSESDVLMAKSLVSTMKLDIPRLEQALRESENALAVLLGKTPQEADGLIGEPGPIPSIPPTIAVGIPADLLRRRPDVRRAEFIAHSECARIGMAKASILPSFNLIGSIGLASTDSDRFFHHDSATGAVGGMVSFTDLIMYPFSVERVRLADAQYEESLLAYKSTVLRAYAEAENAMNAYANSLQEHQIAAEGAEAAASSTELTIRDYSQGKVEVSVPLMALTYQASLQDRTIAAQGAAAMYMVATYKALGGGWENRTTMNLVPEEIRERMQERTDWKSFTGKKELNTQQLDSVPE